MLHRLQKLRKKLIENELDAILVSQPENRRYLSGFTGSAGYLIISDDSAILATDFRYIEQAESQAPEFTIFRISGGFSEWLPDIVHSLRAKRLGFEANDLTFATYRQLSEAREGIQLLPTGGIIESLRAVKDEDEIGHIKRAVELSDAAFDYILQTIKAGMTEREVAWELERFMRENGSESLPFEIIVASGPNSALPHAQPSERPISEGEPIVIDMGARVEGYSSDLSRTICLGPRDRSFEKIYDLVLGAQLTAIATIEAGMSGEMADELARTVIEKGGYGKRFGHGLGHGVGLAPHEEPRLGPNSPDILADGMVFTIEPGIYISGWGGVRIEDVVLMENGRARVLSKAKKID